MKGKGGRRKKRRSGGFGMGNKRRIMYPATLRGWVVCALLRCYSSLCTLLPCEAGLCAPCYLATLACVPCYLARLGCVHLVTLLLWLVYPATLRGWVVFILSPFYYALSPLPPCEALLCAICSLSLIHILTSRITRWTCSLLSLILTHPSTTSISFLLLLLAV